MTYTKLSIRLDLPGGTRFGPGKAALLEAIGQAGSISGAARALVMSYPRALRLVEEMNTQFKAPLVTTYQGGAMRGGATLTENGKHILHLYSQTQTAASLASQPFLKAISAKAVHAANSRKH